MHATSVWLSSLALAAAGGWFAASVMAGPATGKEPRFLFDWRESDGPPVLPPTRTGFAESSRW